MPKNDEEIRKSVKKYEESLSDSERNPNVQKDVEQLIERAAQTLPVSLGKQPRRGGYSGKQTHLRNTEGTSAKHSGKSHQ